MRSIVFVFCLNAGSLLATAYTWNNVAGADWSVPGNWTPGSGPPGAADSATFGSIITAASVIGLTTAPSVNAVTFNNATFAYTLGTGVQTLTLATPAPSIAVTSGTHSIPAALTLGDNLTITGAGTLTISGIIGVGAQSVTVNMTSPGNVTFSGANSYSGGTVISGGTLNISAEGNLGGAGTAVTIGSGTLQITAAGIATPRSFTLSGAASIDVTAGAVTATISGVIGGSGSLNKIDSGILILNNGSNNYSGGTTISAGTLSIGSDANLGGSSGSLTIGGATLTTTAAITSARSGSFTGAAQMNLTGSNVFTGNFSGTGSLTLLAGNLTLTPTSGVNSYSGGTTVSGGTILTGDTNGLQGAIANSGSVVFPQTFNGTYSGALTGAGTLTKSGSGTVQFTGSSAQSSTTITAGTLNVNGTLTGAMTITAGTLSGTGTVGATTNNGGTIDPGNGTSVGTLNTGALTLNSGSVNISIAPLSADSIAVTGAATLGGSLTIEPTPGFYGFDTCYTIVTSTGALGGAFAPITSTNPNFVPTVTYPDPGNTALLCVAILDPFATFPFSNKNTRAVGENLTDLSAAGELSADLTSILTTLVGQSFSTINFALDQMHPAQLSALTEWQAELGGELLALFHRAPYLVCCCNNPSRLWITPFGDSFTLKRHGIQIGAQSNGGGVAWGYDGELSDHFLVGLGGAWSRSHLHWHDHRGHAEINGLYGSLYADYHAGPFYLGASALAGMDFYHTSRHIQFLTTNRHARAKPVALDIMAGIATAYLFGAPQAFFYPYANVDFLYLHTHKFQEHGAEGLNLTVSKRDDSTLRTEMGLALQVQDTNAAETMCISPKIAIGWVNMTPIQRHSYPSAFEGAAILFKTYGWKETWNLLHLGFGLSFAHCNSSFNLSYNADISPDSDTLFFNQYGDIRLDVKW